MHKLHICSHVIGGMTMMTNPITVWAVAQRSHPSSDTPIMTKEQEEELLESGRTAIQRGNEHYVIEQGGNTLLELEE